MKRRFFAIFLVAVMLLSAIPLSVSAENTENTENGESTDIQIWDGTIDDSGLEGEGTIDDPFLISTAAELAFLSYGVNDGCPTEDIYFALTNDIYLNDMSAENWIENAVNNGTVWNPVGNKDYMFNGHFDGNGHTVYGLCVIGNNKTGLFGYINYGSVSNLHVKGYVELSDDTSLDPYACYAGGIVGGAGDSLIENCSFEGVVDGCIPLELKYITNVGGIVGCSSNTTIKDCVNLGEIYGNEMVGGIAGYAINDPTLSDTSHTTVSDSAVMVKNCYNSGAVVGKIYVGGIIGAVQADIVEVLIADCYNIGSVSAEYSIETIAQEHGTRIGGIVGIISGCTLKDCYNAGSVEGAFNIGGIAGELSGWRAAIIAECVNFGDVKGNLGDAGGIVGVATHDSHSISITRCRNAGDISAGSYAGGIFSYGNGTPGTLLTVSDCYNEGSLTVLGTTAGGVSSDVQSAHVTNCYNVGKGEVKNTDVPEDEKQIFCGITAVAGEKTEFENCYYLDSVAEAGSLSDAEGIYALSDEQMQDNASFENFDFETVWTMDGRGNYLYPELVGCAEFFLRGDVNNNGKIDTQDYLMVKRAYFGTYDLNGQDIGSFFRADVNNNGKIDTQDYLMLKRMYFGTYFTE